MIRVQVGTTNQTLPDDIHTRWVEIDCDCGGIEVKHTNWFKMFDGDFLCIAAQDDDGVVYKWRVDLVPSGRVANGFAHTIEEAKLAAEMTAKAVVTDRAAYYERHPEERPPVQ